MRNSYGNAESVYKGVNAVLNGLKSWQILSEGSEKSSFVFEGNFLNVATELQKNLLVVAVIQNAENEAMTIEQINNAASMFPFVYDIRREDITLEQLEVVSDRLDNYVSIISK